MKWKYLGGKDITFYAQSLILSQKIPPCPRDAGKNKACKRRFPLTGLTLFRLKSNKYNLLYLLY